MSKKRSKRSRLRGRRTCGYGSRKKHRGSGSRGGYGMAGTGKMAGQKKIALLKYSPGYLGKKGFTSLNRLKREKLKVINLDEIQEKINNFIKEGIAKKTGEGIELNFKNFKILSRGKEELKEKWIVHAKQFSKKAEEKIINAGGKAIKEEYKRYIKKELEKKRENKKEK